MKRKRTQIQTNEKKNYQVYRLSLIIFQHKWRCKAEFFWLCYCIVECILFRYCIQAQMNTYEKYVCVCWRTLFIKPRKRFSIFLFFFVFLSHSKFEQGERANALTHTVLLISNLIWSDLSKRQCNNLANLYTIMGKNNSSQFPLYDKSPFSLITHRIVSVNKRVRERETKVSVLVSLMRNFLPEICVWCADIHTHTLTRIHSEIEYRVF